MQNQRSFAPILPGLRVSGSAFRWARVLVVLVLSLVMIAPAGAQRRQVTVPANPLWTNTGMMFTPNQGVSIHDAVGTWNWGGPKSFGPGGDPAPLVTPDLWIRSGRHGQLIGAILPFDFNPNTFPRILKQDDPRVFSIGTASVSKMGVIYDLDAPGLTVFPGLDIGMIYRRRTNFLQSAAFEDMRCSNDFAWFVRQSIRRADNPLRSVVDTSVEGDNQIGPGATPLTWNLW